MNSIRKENLKDALVRVINSYSPEYIGQAEDYTTTFFALVDSIENFEDDCEESLKLETEKNNTLDELQGKTLTLYTIVRGKA